MIETFKIRITKPLPLDESECSLKVGDVVEVIDVIRKRLGLYVVKDPITDKQLRIYDYEAEME
jgi:hypothetical protein